MTTETPQERSKVRKEAREAREKVIDERLALATSSRLRILNRLGDEPNAAAIVERLHVLLADFARRPDLSELRARMKFLRERFDVAFNAAETLRMVFFTGEELDEIEDWLHESDSRKGVPAGRQEDVEALHRLKETVAVLEEMLGPGFDTLKHVVTRYFGEEAVTRREGRPSPKEPTLLAKATLRILRDGGVKPHRDKGIVREILRAGSLKVPKDLKDIMREARGKGRRVRPITRGKPSRRSSS